ncbi:UDP-N-acetylmuramoyl-L-alanine--D-glutamate ligase [Carboxydothermus ferrireducens]|uniref:UDP-N-acetylmuramoylalanine--D-glutamate ligase n=1 Tax=Carboxydothermus ferrireducens DSM 11255 TaxID=1119529 RepID=A0ABX2RC76_9THEO|nr:UDP-N-acetylmuramoyl-L-alanine--D-glutamate ligase [Carboxydothermus ferrireducens]NYE58786.1 UDP-N-acetylmuramoylalanine--D-glutamate ligase [Carboxydothermus ferrireducens DSM 11255]
MMGLYTNKRILVVGAGKSGRAAAAFLIKRGAKVVLTDKKMSLPVDEELKKLAEEGVELVLGGYPLVKDWELLVVSPGVPLTEEPIVYSLKEGIPVLGEIELAYKELKAPIIAVTGTNGKTTTTSWIGEVLKIAGFKTLIAGNIGYPLIEAVEEEWDAVSLEVSSFQLETIKSFKPKVAVLLNLTPDHLDRHKTLEGYLEAKARIFINQDRTDITVLNYDDPRIRSLGRKTPGRVFYFSQKEELEEGVFVKKGKIVVRSLEVEEEIIDIKNLPLPGPHNLENALATVAACWSFGVSGKNIEKGLRNFQGVAHRLEKVAEINGVLYVNDSKGTNPDSTIKALNSYERPIVLIAGGRNKGNSFGELAREIREKVRFTVLVGECREELKEALEMVGYDKYVIAESFEDAVKKAKELARPGDVVLLSPAAASWDMFKNYEERGELFKRLVLNMVEG